MTKVDPATQADIHSLGLIDVAENTASAIRDISFASDDYVSGASSRRMEECGVSRDG